MTDAQPELNFAGDRAIVALALARFVERYLGGLHGPVADAVRYSVEGEGKRLRAILVLSAYRAAGGTGDATGLAAAIEVVHAYSLVHDDLPCMDDDDVRRGRPTVPKAPGVAAATPAGLPLVPSPAGAARPPAADPGLRGPPTDTHPFPSPTALRTKPGRSAVPSG